MHKLPYHVSNSFNMVIKELVQEAQITVLYRIISVLWAQAVASMPLSLCIT